MDFDGKRLRGRGSAGGDCLKQFVNGDGSPSSPFSSRFSESFVNLRDNKRVFSCLSL